MFFIILKKINYNKFKQLLLDSRLVLFNCDIIYDFI